MESVDPGLILSLEKLLRTASVSEAAREAGLSPPAMSRVLKRLREQLGDPLLVRAGHQMVLTPRGEAIRDGLPAVLAALERVLTADQGRPRLERPFVIRTGSGLPSTFGPALLRMLQDRVDGAALTFVAEGEEDVSDLRSGRVHLDLGVQDHLGPEIRTRRLLTDHMVGLVRVGVEGDPEDLDTWCARPHVAVSRRGEAWGPADEALAALGRRRDVPVVLASVADAGWFVASGDYLGMAPSGLAAPLCATLPLRTFAIPVPLPPMHLDAAWHPRFQDDPAHRVLRECVVALASGWRGTTRARPPRGMKQERPGQPSTWNDGDP